MNESVAEKNDPAFRPASRREFLRWAVRAVVLVVAILVLLSIPIQVDAESTVYVPVLSRWLSPWMVSDSAVAKWTVLVPGLSPLVAISAIFATKTFQATVWIGLVIAVVTLIRRRWFCRWVCPTGTCADSVSRLSLRLGRRCPRLPALGQWLALITLGGALLGYPLFLWLDPLALLGGAFGVVQAETSPDVWWCASGMAVVLVLSLIWPSSWCSRLCPLGATQDVLWSGVDALKRSASSGQISNSQSSTVSRNSGLSRRIVLGGLVGAAWATATRSVKASSPRPLRPPGAADETQFAGLCIRCGNCQRVCPTQIIRPDAGNHGFAGLLAPVLDFHTGYCREDCSLCSEVCPSGALIPLTPDDKLRVPIGLPQVNMDVCLLGEDFECSLCRNWCPYEAITYVFSEASYTLTPKIDPAKCPGCGACEVVCPTTPAKAIQIHPLEGARR